MDLIEKLTDKSHDEAYGLFSLSISLEEHRFALSPWSRNQFFEELELASGLGYFVGGVLKAFVLFRAMDGGADITLLVTDPRSRRRGYMKSLLLHLMEKTDQIHSLRLEVHEKNAPAQGLYCRLGFYKQRVRPNYYRDGGAAWLFEYKCLL